MTLLLNLSTKQIHTHREIVFVFDFKEIMQAFWSRKKLTQSLLKYFSIMLPAHYLFKKVSCLYPRQVGYIEKLINGYD